MQSTFEVECNLVDAMMKHPDMTTKEFRALVDAFKVLTELSYYAEREEIEIACVDEKLTLDAQKMEIESRTQNAKLFRGVSKDAIVSALTSVLWTGMVLNHERLNVITSKAFRTKF